MLLGDQVTERVLDGGHVYPRPLAAEERKVADCGALGTIIDFDLAGVANGQGHLDPSRNDDLEKLARRVPLGQDRHAGGGEIDFDVRGQFAQVGCVQKSERRHPGQKIGDFFDDPDAHDSGCSSSICDS
jgi:hypothetical protein